MITTVQLLRNNHQLPGKRGFTLIEIMVAMSIIAVLTAVIGANYVTSRIRARDSERKNALGQVQRAFELYFNDYGRYPEDIDDTRLACCAWGEAFVDDHGTTYMVQLPSDSRYPDYEFKYEVDDTGKKYRLYARLENTKDGDTDLNGDGSTNDEFDGNHGDGTPKQCGIEHCNYGIASSTTTMEEVW